MLLDVLYIAVFALFTIAAFLFAALRTAQISRDAWKKHNILLAKQRDSALAMLSRDSGLLNRWTRSRPALEKHVLKREMLDRHSVLVDFINNLE